MSAILTSTTASEVEMLADGLTYTNDGTIVARSEKITVGARLPWAMNVRGPAAVGDLLKMAARVVEPLGFVEMLKVLSSTISDMPEFRELPIAEVVIAGVMDGQPQVWRGFTHDYAGLPAGQLQMLDDRYVGGAMGEPTPDQWQALGVVPEAPDGVLRAKAVEVMELLRTLPGPVYGVEDSPAVYGVGGHVQYVRIGADGVMTSEIVHDWPEDVVGERVGAIAALPV